ncbi:MAG TPA: thiamine pyrophosphate-dependent enzyme [Armatimonadota bacterium]|nr:thiamine pyrophosphate-dependent enzyme [Armatimonadota bacterium]
MRDALQLLEQMQTIRRFEETAKQLYHKGLVYGALHLYIGEEAVAVGVCSALREDDYFTSTHRGHGHCIAKGGDLGRMMAELLGRETGYSRGRGGSMHLFAPEIGLLGGNGIVGAGIPIATGAAYAVKYRGGDQVVICFFGDGAANQGTFHESLNMAALWQLPIVYVCENNHYAATTAVTESLCVPDVAMRAAGYGISGEVVDGNDVLLVRETAKRAIARARAGEGPSLLECNTYRYEGHCMVLHDHRHRPRGEEEGWRRRDPITCLERRMLASGDVTPAEVEDVRRRADAAVAAAAAFAMESPYPDSATFIAEHPRGNWQCVR